MLHSNCQVCGNPMYSQSYFGTEAGGQLNPDFCSNCYKSGQFHASQDGYSKMYSTAPWTVLNGGGKGVGM